MRFKNPFSSPPVNGGGLIITLEGRPSIIAEQLRLIPFSRNILCLLPLDSDSQTSSAVPILPSTSPDETEDVQSSFELVRKYVLRLHDAHISRLQKAQGFLANSDTVDEELASTGKSRKIVFLNGGRCAAKRLCVEKIRELLPGLDLKEAEELFEEIVSGERGGEESSSPPDSTIEKTAEDGLKEEEEAETTASGSQDDAGTAKKENEDDSTKENIKTDKQVVDTSFNSPSTMATTTTTTTTAVESNNAHAPTATIAENIASDAAAWLKRTEKIPIEKTAATFPKEAVQHDQAYEIAEASVAVRVQSSRSTLGRLEYSPPPSPSHSTLEKQRSGSWGVFREITVLPDQRRPSDDKTTHSHHEKEVDETKRHQPAIFENENFHTPPPSSAGKGCIPNSGPPGPNIEPSLSSSSSSTSSSAALSSPCLTPALSCITTATAITPCSSAAVSLKTSTRIYADEENCKSEDGQVRSSNQQSLFSSVEEERLVIFFEEEKEDEDKASRQRATLLMGTMRERSSTSTAISMSQDLRSGSALHPLAADILEADQHRRNLFHADQSKNLPLLKTSIASEPVDIESIVEPAVLALPNLALTKKILVTSRKSPVEIQNEFRALMAAYFPPPPQSPDSPLRVSIRDHDHLEWLLQGDDEETLWRPVLSGIGQETEGVKYWGLDMIVAIGSEVPLGNRMGIGRTDVNDEMRKGFKLAERLRDTIVELGKKKSLCSRGTRLGLKHLLASTTAQSLSQHSSSSSSTIRAIATGRYLLPKLEEYVLHNPDLRFLVLDFDLHTGSEAILEFKRLLAAEESSDFFKVICIADAATQISDQRSIHSFSDTASSKTKISVRTEAGKGTTSYTLDIPPKQKPSQAAPKLASTDSYRSTTSVRSGAGGKSTSNNAKRSLIAGADFVLHPFTNAFGPAFGDAVCGIESSLRSRERLTGAYEEDGDGGMEEDEGNLTIGGGEGGVSGLEEDDDEEEEQWDKTKRQSLFRERVKHGSKALKLLGLES